MSNNSPSNPLLGIAVLAVAGVAIKRELAKPKGERTWHGTVGVPVPYDFRVPTVEKIKAAYWSPDNPAIVGPQAFGVGWTVNLGRLWAIVSGKK